jgi:hypothetical protein
MHYIPCPSGTVKLLGKGIFFDIQAWLDFLSAALDRESFRSSTWPHAKAERMGSGLEISVFVRILQRLNINNGALFIVTFQY